MTRPTRDRTLLVLALILLAGAFLRVGYLQEARQQPDFDHPLIDAGFHDYWARGLAFGTWNPPVDKDDPQVRTTPYFRPPGYPYLLAFVYKLTGGGYVGPRVVQMALGLVNIVLAFWLARRLFGNLSGLITAGLMASYWGLIYFEAELQATVFATTLLLLLALALGTWTRGLTWRRTLLVGALIGLGALMRPNFLVYLPVAVGWSVWQLAVHRHRQQLVMVVAGLVIGCGVVVLPATVRNLRASGEMVAITTGGGINLYLGNNPDAKGISPPAIRGLGKFSTCYDYPVLVRNLSRELGRPVSHREFSAILADRAVDYMLANPGRTAALTWHKALLFWGPAEVSNNKVVQMERENSVVLRMLPWNFSIVLGLALLGAVTLMVSARRPGWFGDGGLVARGPERWQLVWLVALLILGWFLSLLPFFAAARFRVPMLPLLLVMAGFGVTGLVALVRARRWPATAAWVALGLVLVLFASVDLAGYQLNRARWHYVRGFSHLFDREWSAAIDELESALRLKPEYTQAHVDLGVALQKTGRSREAVRHLEQALTLDPESAITHYNLASVMGSLGQLSAARDHLRLTLEIDPNFRGARQALQQVERVLQNQQRHGTE